MRVAAVLALSRRLDFFLDVVVVFAKLFLKELFKHGASFAECGECGCSGSSSGS